MLVILDNETNELTIGWDNFRRMRIMVQDVSREIQICCGYEISDIVYGWHRYCFTYNSAGSVKVRDKSFFLKLSVLDFYCIGQFSYYLSVYLSAK